MSKLKYPKHLKREASAFLTMHRRCLKPAHADYKWYGGNGIKICPQWLNNWPQFLADMGPAPSPRHWLGRKDVLGDYEPQNCIWTEPAPQIRRKAVCKKIQFNGELLTIGQVEKTFHLKDGTLRQRLKAGIPMDVALTAKPCRTGRPPSSKQPINQEQPHEHNSVT